MTSKFKATLIAGAIALTATLGAVGTAEAGGRHRIPFAPYNAYLPGSYDDDDEYDSYGCDDCGYGSKADSALSTARRVTRDMLGVDVGDVIDEIAE
jgi:hypothetical protein